MKHRDYHEMNIKQYVAYCVQMAKEHGLVPAFPSSSYFFHNCYIEGNEVVDAVTRAKLAGIYTEVKE